MSNTGIQTPRLATVYSGPLHHIEEEILNQADRVEEWFHTQWKNSPPPITTSVDLRYSGYKLAPVDTNLFPAGFNNLNPDLLPLCTEAAKLYINSNHPHCKNILILPESHTRNTYYLQSLSCLKNIFSQSGYVVRIGSLDKLLHNVDEYTFDSGEKICIEPILLRDSRIVLSDFEPDLLLLNNDLSTGIPDILRGCKQPIEPAACLGWGSRLKSSHFLYYEKVVSEFSQFFGLDPWFFLPSFTAVEGIDFMAQDGIDKLVHVVDELLQHIQEKYKTYGIKEKPFVAVKADNGTYGMSVMMVHESLQLFNLNRKQRKKMAATKGSQIVSKVIVQEGIHSIERMPNKAVAEPVVYMIGQSVVGGFYRAHKSHGHAENLNAIGMYFEPMHFENKMAVPNLAHGATQEIPHEVWEVNSRFYIYGVVARLGTLAAALETLGVTGECK